MFEKVKACEPAIVKLRKRFDKAKAAGQVELHMGLGEMEMLLTLAEGVLQAINRPSV
jgi:hypothetical protein